MEDKKQFVVAIDFDGTIVEYDEWRGWEHIGEPLDGALQAIQTFATIGFKVIIYTTRANPTMPDYEQAQAEVLRWLDERGVGVYVHEVTGLKPLADVYIDDRAIRFENWRQVEEDLGKLHAIW